MTSDTMYETANDVFDSVVFTYDDDLALYNADETDRSRDELYSIIDQMIEAAIEAGEEAMYRVAYEKRDDFLDMVRGNGQEEEA